MKQETQNVKFSILIFLFHVGNKRNKSFFYKQYYIQYNQKPVLSM